MATGFRGTSPLATKLVLMGIIVLGLMIPLTLLRGLVSERREMRDQAVATVAQGWGGELVLGGPILRVPFETERKGASAESIREVHDLFVLADDLNIEAHLEQAPPRRVSLYEVPVYTVKARLTGRFRMPVVRLAAGAGPYGWTKARLRLPLSDVRSVRQLVAASVGGRALQFEPSKSAGPAGIEAAIDLSLYAPDAELPFTIELVLAGSRSMAVIPTASTTTLRLAADWPDPQFQGAFLPARYDVHAGGFAAQWQVLALNRSFGQSWVDNEISVERLQSSSFGVNLYQSVDVYQRTERAVKYALLFIVLTFLSFFGWEKLSDVRVHAMQYLFIGLALSTFYLLLIALSEHIDFAWSFWLGAGALVALLGSYVGGFTARASRGGVVAGLMVGVYAVLYLLVLSEDYALLLGSIVLFVALATLMLATRRIRWEE